MDYHVVRVGVGRGIRIRNGVGALPLSTWSGASLRF